MSTATIDKEKDDVKLGAYQAEYDDDEVYNESTLVERTGVIPAIYDVTFKAIFGRGNEEIVVGFLKSILSIPDEEFEKITFSDPQIHRRRKKDKYCIVDLLLHTKNDNVIHVEIQKAKMENFSNRAIYYNSSLIQKQLSESDNYAKLKKTISILIVDFRLFESPTYMRTFQLRCPEGEMLGNIIEYHVLEIPKVPKEFDGTSKCCWAQFFASKDEEELNLVAEKDPVIKKAVSLIMELSEDEKNQWIAEREEDARRVREDIELYHRNRGMETGMKAGMKAGIKTGIKTGIKQEKEKIARKMLDNGLDLEAISKFTDLSVEELSKLN